jgi:4'-phosphopantetheinyl transferase
MITVWRVPLDAARLLTPERLGWLSREETTRADRFRDARHAQRWRIAHIALREILGAEVGVAPGQLRFGAGDNGKPFLWLSGGPTFNLSHADDLALVAIGGDTPLGVDVEYARSTPDLREIAASHFSREERAVIDDLSDIELVDCFYRCWTRKEAFVKAIGTGIGHDLMSFAVSLDAATTRVLHERGDAARGATWTLRDLGLTFPYVGALATRAPHVDIQVLEWGER